MDQSTGTSCYTLWRREWLVTNCTVHVYYTQSYTALHQSLSPLSSSLQPLHLHCIIILRPRLSKQFSSIFNSHPLWVGDDPLPGFSTRSTISLDPLNLPQLMRYPPPLPLLPPLNHSFVVLTAPRCGGGCRAPVRPSQPVSPSSFYRLWSLRSSIQTMTQSPESLCL